MTDISSYLRAFATELGERILGTYPPLQGVDDLPSPLLGQILRRPFPAQTLAIMGVVKRWDEARTAAVIAECGTGKTLISLAAAHVHSAGRPFTALAMVPPQLVEKWGREAFRTLPRVRVLFIDGLRSQTSANGHAGVNEVRLRSGRIVREGLRTTLTEFGFAKDYDAIVTVCTESGEHRFALEYERSPKMIDRYKAIAAALSIEEHVSQVLYLVTSDDLLRFVSSHIGKAQCRVYFGLARDWHRQLLDMPVTSCLSATPLRLRETLDGAAACASPALITP